MHHKLLESLADEIGRAALEVDSRIEAITVSVTKLRPPVPAHVDTVGVQRRVSR
jgi:dihydroneopterin aldolase